MKTMTHITRQNGFTIIEVLVTVVILAIGLLGLAGLQLSGLQNNTTAYERSQASILAYDIIDRMRANRDSVASYVTPLDNAPTSTTCYGSAADCTPAEAVVYDINVWKCSLGKWVANANCTALVTAGALTTATGKLTNGDGSITYSAANQTVTVTIQWEEDRDGTTTSMQVTTLI